MAKVRLPKSEFRIKFEFRKDCALLRSSILWGLSMLLFIWASGQSAPPPLAVSNPSPDPLYNLMLSQPRVDLDTEIPPSAYFDPPVVRPGEQSIYRVTFQALEQSVEWPATFPGPKDLQTEPGAHGQMLQLTGAAFVPITCFNTRVRASRAGTFVVPAFEVRIYDRKVTVPAATLTIRPDAPDISGATQLLIEAEKTNLFVGQPVTVRVRLPGLPNGAIQGVQQFQIAGRGLLVDVGAIRQSITPSIVAGRQVPAMTYEATVTPVKAGELNFFAQGFSLSSFFSAPSFPPGGNMSPGAFLLAQGRPILLESSTIHASARQLPREGQLPGFTGAVGKISFTGASLETNVLRVGDPVRLTASFDCDNDVLRLVPPLPPRLRDWQVFAAPTNTPITQPNRFRRLAVFSYTLVPLSESIRTTPPIAFSSFDPEKAVYADLTIPAVPVSIKPGLAPADVQALVRSDRLISETEEAPVLSGLAAAPGRAASRLEPPQYRAWFLAAQIIPLAGFTALWLWDRRRRYYAQNPGALLRIRARRALRRERRALRHAAKMQDEEGFATRAVSAMRVACAPHYPAEPRALVGREVMAVLCDTNAATRSSEIVRLVFSAADSRQYNASRSDNAKLLTMQPDIERVIGELEARL